MNTDCAFVIVVLTDVHVLLSNVAVECRAKSNISM